MNKERLWTKEFVIVSFINFLLTLMYFLLMVTIASYAKTEFHASTSLAGLVSSIFIIGALIGRLLTGRAISHIGTKKTLWIGLGFFAVTSLLYFFAVHTSFLLVNRLLQGIAVGIASTATGTIIAQILPASRKGEGIGYYSLSAILATAIGPFLGMILLRLENGFTWIFTLNVVFSLICLLFYAMAKINVPLPSTSVKEEAKGSLLSKFIEPKALPISFVALLIGFSYSGVLSFLSFYAEEINLTSASSYFFLVYAIVIILSRPFSGKLMDARGANIVTYPSLVIFAAGMLIFSQASTSWMLLLSAALIGVGFGNFNSIAQTVAVKVTAPHRFGLATSTYYIMYDLGLGIGPYLLGFIVPHTGYRMIFSGMVAFILFSIPLYHWLHGKRDRELIRAT
ncbi:MFS transporter [Brevibacillus sp. M2.1A]|uniref:MFS transporter n=1 Tax=Brevibacillus TaxID=55080 RepID=UPI00156B4BCA|nr:MULTISPECIES: MFS transporter [Brevibacillus]MCC8436345.1 MFS transporter [Brevibacillus sp. M2.1A]MCE0448342.1 MFS transporter [Brevibacillus sp. AF8]UKK98549.1 MFS transporter [Brevibacillus brevis]